MTGSHCTTWDMLKVVGKIFAEILHFGSTGQQVSKWTADARCLISIPLLFLQNKYIYGKCSLLFLPGIHKAEA